MIGIDIQKCGSISSTWFSIVGKVIIDPLIEAANVRFHDLMVDAHHVRLKIGDGKFIVIFWILRLSTLGELDLNTFFWRVKHESCSG